MKRYKKRFATEAIGSGDEPPVIAFPKVSDAYGERSQPHFECVLLQIKHLALFHDVPAALSFCATTANLYGSQLMSFTAIRIDPIFLGAMTDNPWQFLYSNVRYWNKPPELLALLYACGWNRKTTPERFKKYISQRSKFAKVIMCTPEQVLMPWKIPGAKKLVREHYFYDGQPGIPTSYFAGMLGPDNINIMIRYVQLMEKFELLPRPRLNFMKSHIRYVLREIKKELTRPHYPIEDDNLDL